jgi:hypothetical protein
MSKGRYANALERARGSAEFYLAHFRPEWRGVSLLEVLASVYGKEEGDQGKAAVAGSDIAAWPDAFGEGDLPQQIWRPWLAGLSPARETMAALRQVGLLGEVIETKEGLVVWPAGLEAESV